MVAVFLVLVENNNVELKIDMHFANHFRSLSCCPKIKPKELEVLFDRVSFLA